MRSVRHPITESTQEEAQEGDEIVTKNH